MNASCDAEQRELKRAANRRYAQSSQKTKRERIDELGGRGGAATSGTDSL